VGDSRYGRSATEGVSERICVFSAIDASSSKMNGPDRLFAYATTPAATMIAARHHTDRRGGSGVAIAAGAARGGRRADWGRVRGMRVFPSAYYSFMRRTEIAETTGSPRRRGVAEEHGVVTRMGPVRRGVAARRARRPARTSRPAAPADPVEPAVSR